MSTTVDKETDGSGYRTRSPSTVVRYAITARPTSGLFDSKKDLRSYRPIFVLPLLSKVFGNCIYNRLRSFHSKKNVLRRYKFGFQKKKNTTDPLLNYIEYVYRQLNGKSHTVGVALDFSKAFDAVSQDILLRKLFNSPEGALGLTDPDDLLLSKKYICGVLVSMQNIL